MRNWAQILKYLIIDLPWGFTLLGVYIFAFAISLFMIVLLVKVFASLLVGFSDGIPFNVLI